MTQPLKDTRHPDKNILISTSLQILFCKHVLKKLPQRMRGRGHRYLGKDSALGVTESEESSVCVVVGDGE